MNRINHRAYRDFDAGSWWGTSLHLVGRRPLWQRVLMFFGWRGR